MFDLLGSWTRFALFESRILASILFAIFGLTSCQDPAPPTVAAAPEPEVIVENPSPTPLVILTWDEYFSQEVVTEFEKETGRSVEFVTFENLDEMEALLRSRPSDFDLVVVDGGTLADLIELQLVQPVDRAKIPNFKNLDSKFLGTKFDPENRFSVPYMWGTTLIVYRSDKIDAPKPSWSSLWDEQYRGKTLMLDDKFDVYAASLLAEGFDINSQNATELNRATERLLGQVESLDVRFVDIFKIRESLLSGDCWIGMTYSSDAAVLAEEEKNIAYFIPDEGAPLWIDSFAIPKDSKNSDLAHDFLDFISRGEVAAANSNGLWCASVNRAARPLISEEVLADPTIYLDEEVLARCQFDTQTTPERQLLVNQGLKKIFDRVREKERLPTVSLLTWDDYYSPEVIARFEAENGCRVLITEVENSERLKQVLSEQPDRFDVVVADEATLRDLISLKHLRELTPALLPSILKEDSRLASPADPDGKYSVPYLWGLTVLAGRKEVLIDAEPSWKLLWEEGLRVGILDEPNDFIWVALLSHGYDPANVSEEQLHEVEALIGKRLPNFTSHMRDTLSGVSALEAGELDLVVVYNGDALARASQDPSISVILPKEGAPLWIDSLAVTRDSRNPELAHRFLMHAASPEMSAMTANHLHFATPSEEARKFVDPGLLANPVLYPSAEDMERCVFVEFPPPIQRAVNQTVSRLVSGGRSKGTSNVSGKDADGGLATSTSRDDGHTED